MIERATSRLDLQPPIIVRAERCAAGALNKHTLSDLWATNSTCCHPTTIALSHGTWCFHIGYSALRARAQFRMRYLRGSQRASSARGWHFGARNTRNWWLCTRFRCRWDDEWSFCEPMTMDIRAELNINNISCAWSVRHRRGTIMITVCPSEIVIFFVC